MDLFDTYGQQPLSKVIERIKRKLNFETSAYITVFCASSSSNFDTFSELVANKLDIQKESMYSLPAISSTEDRLYRLAAGIEESKNNLLIAKITAIPKDAIHFPHDFSQVLKQNHTQAIESNRKEEKRIIILSHIEKPSSSRQSELQFYSSLIHDAYLSRFMDGILEI